MRRTKNVFGVLFLTFSIVLGCASQRPATARADSMATALVDVRQFGHAPDCCTAQGKQWAIASGGEASSQAGAEILAAGGNIVDAAVATAFALGVERPHSAGIGGGGFLTLHLAGPQGGDFFVDFRETAPRRATRDMYLDPNGKPIPKLSTDGALAIATPGFVLGLEEIHEKWGKLPWKQVLQPAIRLAEKGFPIYPKLAAAIEASREFFRSAYTRRTYLRGDRPARAGETLVQKDLARTMRQIADHGSKIFYHGAIADRIVVEVRKGKGILDKKDLAAYQVKYRTPVAFDWHGFHFVSAPPPSAGGVMLGQMLKVLAGFDLDHEAQEQARYAHLLSEVMKRGYADRSEFAGDPDFVSTPWQKVLSDAYADTLRKHLDLARNTPSQQIQPGEYLPEDHGTTHLSIVDDQGNALASTLTINTEFGSGVVASGTGIILNNEMDDFSIAPGVPNEYGLTGAEANSIAPGKRPVSSMTPTVVLKNGQPVLAVGGAGGSRIISGVTQVILGDLALFPYDVHHAQFASRMHQQWLPDRLDLETGFSRAAINELHAMGHQTALPAWNVIVQAVGRDASGALTAVFDPRDAGGAVAK